MASLKVIVANGEDYTSVSFAINNVEFVLYDVSSTDYYEAARACETHSNWESNMISVSEGVVIICIHDAGGSFGGMMTCKLDAEACTEAFKEAYAVLSAAEASEV